MRINAVPAQIVLLIALSALPAMAQQATRADFNEFAKVMAGRWVGQVTFIADWPGQGKKGEKVTAYCENRIAKDGNAITTECFGGTGSGVSVIVYDAGAKQIKEMGVDSGGTTFTNIYTKVSATKWAQTQVGSLADGSKIEGKYEANITENGNTWNWSGPTTIAGKKQDDLHDVWRKVSK